MPNHLINDLKGLIDQTKFESILPNHHIQTGIIDSGSSILCTPHEDDFLPKTFKPLLKQKKINGIARGLQITHTGMTNYETIDTKGRIVKIKCKGYLIPGLPHRLLPHQKPMRDEFHEWYKMNDKQAILEFKDGQNVKTPYNNRTKLPFIFIFKDKEASIDTIHNSLFTCDTKETNQNLNNLQRETLKWHWRFGHCALFYIHWISRRGILGSYGDRICNAIS